MSRAKILFTVALGALVAGCGDEPIETAPELRPVRTVRAAFESARVPRTLAGVAQAAVESRLSFRVPGTIEWIGVTVGDRVRRGQPLARLDPTDYELRVEEAVAALAQGEAGLRRAEADFDRARSLYENNNASKSEFDAARAAKESAEAQVDATRKRLEQARQQLGYAVLRAPAPGAVASVGAEVNENVASGREILLLTTEQDLEVSVAVPEVMIPQIEIGQPATVRFDALPGRTFDARLSEVGVAATGASNTFPVTARLLGDASGVRSGMAAEVTFQIAESGGGERLVVPAVSVGEDGQGRFVFVVDEVEGEVGVVRRRSVEIGRPTQGLTGIEIVDGLEAGEIVVTAGVRRLSDGMRVEVPAAETSVG